ncbi:MAG: amidase [Deltaproteobacteria bacterium]|nr:MAG: amidase [Deltaproteobacteria bacterium]
MHVAAVYPRTMKAPRWLATAAGAVVVLACRGGPSHDATATTTGASGTTVVATTSGTAGTQTGGTVGGSGTAGDTSGGAPRCSEAPEDYLDGSLVEQLAALGTGTLCCADLLAAYLDRIEALDDGPDGIGAVIALDPAAAQAAAALDAQDRPAGPLHCALLLVKDNIDVAGMANTAGSLAMVDNVVPTDAPAVAALRTAGAVVVGKANLSEWANFRGQNSTSGWSSLGGQTKNGANPAYNPCGSSSGSAAAIAAGMVPAALGTETSGSVVCPASMNGVVGFKPTLGLVSRTDVIPIAHSHDTIGPMARTVEDVALLLSVMAGPDPEDPATSEIPPGFETDFPAALEGATFAGKRLGVAPSFVAAFPVEEQALFDAQIARIEAAGATVVDVSLPSTAPLSGPFVTVLTTELKVDLNAYLADHAAPGVPGSLAEIIAFNEANAAEVMPYFGQEWFLQAQNTAGLDDPQYVDALATVRQGAGANGLLPVLEGNDLDAIVLPTTGPAWTTNYATGDAGGPSAAFLPAAAGYPHLTVPMGEVGDRPVGISFIGRPWDDAAMLALGHAYETLP